MSTNRRKFIQQATLAGLAVNSWSESFQSNSNNAFLSPEHPFDAESDLKIDTIESFSKSNITLVKVTANDGSYGYGQVAPYANNITTTVLHQLIVQHALGKDPYQPGAIANNCIEINYKYPWSFVCRATTGIETALWDLRGRREKKPVCELLGGTPKSIPVYGSSMRRDITPKDEAKRIVKLRDENGFEAFKIRVGKVVGHDEDEWPGRTEEIIPTVRKAVGDETILQADANSCYSPSKAIDVGKMMQDYGYYFFEEPCPFWELEWTAEVQKALSMKVAGGEQDNDLAQWRRMIDMNAVSIVQPDICYIGGVSRTLEVAKMAAAKGKTCVPHTANLSLLTVFAMHVLASIPNPAPHMEYSIEDVEWVKGIFTPGLPVINGKVPFPEGPGWGIDVQQSWLSSCEHQISML